MREPSHRTEHKTRHGVEVETEMNKKIHRYKFKILGRGLLSWEESDQMVTQVGNSHAEA